MFLWLWNGIFGYFRWIEEVDYHIEDVIDEYILHVAEHCHEKGFDAFLHKIGKKKKKNHDIATNIQDIKILVREIEEKDMALIPLSQDHEAVRMVKTDEREIENRNLDFFFLIWRGTISSWRGK